MFASADNATERVVDASMTILEFFSPDISRKLSVVGARLEGDHSLRVNRECDQVYYVTKGEGQIGVAGEVHSVKSGSCVFIPAGSSHHLEGRFEMLIINGPAYDFEQTDLLP